MLTLHLHNAGFFPIRWTETAVPGTTYVRPGAKGVLRVFVSAQHDEVKLFAGSLSAGKLCYSGPVHGETELRQLLAAASAGRAIAAPIQPAENYAA